MIRTVRLWARSAQDLETLTNAAQSVFGDVSIVNKGAYVWQNTGHQNEDTRVGMTRASANQTQNPTYRLLAEFNVKGEAFTGLREKLTEVASLLPANHKGSFASGSAVVMAPAKFRVIENGAYEQDAPLMAIA